MVRFSGLTTPIILLLSKSLSTGYNSGNCPHFQAVASWKSKMPTKRAFLLGQPLRQRFPWRICLNKENLTGLVGVLCALEEEETVDYPFTYCFWVS